MIFNKNDNGTDEIAKYATWTKNHDYDHISRALLLAKRKTLKIIDKNTYQKALDHYNSENYEKESPSDEEKLLDELVHHFQGIFVNFAYSYNLHKDTVLWDNSGINVAWTDTFRPAQEHTLDNLLDSFTRDGYEFLDLLIEFLNTNEDIFSDWQQSVEGLKLRQLFIDDEDDFSYYFNINYSVSYFFEILDVIRRVQRNEIYNVIGNWYALVQEYQERRNELEAVTNEVDTMEDLPPDPDPGTIYLVKENNSYYKFTEGWEHYAYDAREMLKLIKPALVETTMYIKFLNDINNINAGFGKQIEIIKANTEYLRQKSQNSLDKLSEYIKSLELSEEEIDESDSINEIISGNNSLMI